MAANDPDPDADQARITRYLDTDPDDRLGGFRDYISDVVGNLRSRLGRFGLDLDWLGQSPSTAQLSGDIWVYQYVEAYSKGSLGSEYDFSETRKPVRQGSPSPQVQFKHGIFVVGKPTTEIENRIQQTDIYRLVTAFDTREYAGYMTGFGFTEKKTYVQRQRVSARDVEQKGADLGVPWFEVEAYDEEGRLAGWADGYSNPFSTQQTTVTTTTGEPAPDQEVWRVQTGRNDARGAGGQWEVGPDARTEARQRTRNATGKPVYVGPFQIGTITSRGTTWLRRQYDPDGNARYTDKKTITSQSGIPPQALQKGAKLYKYREDETGIYLSTTEPPTGYDSVDPDEVSPDQLGEETTSREVTDLLLDDSEPTKFIVENDVTETRLMGLYNPVVVREIQRPTNLVGRGQP